MPYEYTIKTNMGEFDLTLNRPPASNEEVMAAIEAKIAANGGQVKVPTSPSNEPASMVKMAAPVLREQPSPLQEMTNPGGIASAENLGMLAGGTLGATKGAAIGSIIPGWGTAVGGLLGGMLGAGAGSMGGRGYEMLLEKLMGPYRTAGTQPLQQPNRSVGDVVSELGQASQRGMIGEAVGQGVGGLISRLGSKLLAPYGSKMTPEASRAIQIAKDAGIEITPGQALDSGALSRLEGIAKRGITGAEQSYQFGKRQAAESSQAVYNFAESLSPGLSKDLKTVGDFTREAAEGRLEGMRRVVNKFISQVSGGTTLPLKQAGENAVSSKARLFEAIKDAGGKLYKNVEKAAGDAANAIESPNMRNWAMDLVKRESEMQGVQFRTANIAAGAEKVTRPFQPPPTKKLALGDDLALSWVNEYGLAEPKTWTLDALRAWQSRLGSQIAVEKNPAVKRDLVQGFAAVSNDISEWGKKLPNDVNALLKTANNFWRTNVAEIYYDKLVAGIDKAEPDMIASLFLGPQASAVGIDRVKRAIGVPAFQKVVGSYLDDIFTKANNIDGSFSPNKALRILQEHDADVLHSMLGKNIKGQDVIVKMFQHNPTKMIEGILARDGDQVIDYLVPKGGSVESIARLRQLLPNDKFDQFAGGVIKKITDASLDNNGTFSLDRFLSQVNGPSGYKPYQLRSLLGNRYGEFKELTDLFARMNRNMRFSSNPSGTAQGLTAGFQLGGAIYLGFDVASSLAEGKESLGRGITQLGGGIALLSPNLAAKALYSPNGIKWLTQGLKSPPGSRAARQAIEGLTKIATSNSIGISERRPNE